MIRLGTPRYAFDSLDSTMDTLAELARAGAPEGTVVVANEQVAGRGRAGRAWQASPGSALLCSVLLRPALPPRLLGALPLVIGLAVAEAIESIVPIRAAVKWPNDVFIEDRKVCGVLMQARAAGERTDFVNLGIGLNVSTAMNSLPPGATSLAAVTRRSVSIDAVEQAVMMRVSERYAWYLAAGGTPPLSEWLGRAMYVGEHVIVEQNGVTLSGIFTGVSPLGALLLVTENGPWEIVAGDLTRGPRHANPE